MNKYQLFVFIFGLVFQLGFGSELDVINFQPIQVNVSTNCVSTLQTLIIIFLFELFSCGSRTQDSLNNDSIRALDILSDTLMSSQQISISDTIKKFEVDGFPVTNEMLADKTTNNSSYKKQSGQLFSYDKAWFKNDSDTIMEQAERAGAKIIKQAQKTFWGGYAGYFKDIDGHLWEIAHNPALTVDE